MAKIKPDAPIGVVDIGSNSVRLVGYSGTARVPLPIYNERAFCRLGRSVAKRGRIDGKQYELAIKTLHRFADISKRLGVQQLAAFGTAAVREAENGDAFIKEASDILGVAVQCLSGEDEARYTAKGVMLAIPEADGIVADLGGGSLELARVRGGAVSHTASLPLGVLRFDSPTELATELEQAKQTLKDIAWLSEGEELPLYIVGGTWRNLMRIHMAQTDYPLNILHHYYVKSDKLKKFVKSIATLETQEIESLPSVSVNRQENIPAAAALLRLLLKRTNASRAVLSAYAVREGALASLREISTDSISAKDPLLTACEEMGARLCKSPNYAQELDSWTASIFINAQTETFTPQVLERLRRAACLISDIAWSQHPNFRAAAITQAVLTAPFVGITHNERVFLSYALSCRHEASAKPPTWKKLQLTRADEKLARGLGLSFRLAHSLSASMTGLLANTSLTNDGETLLLKLNATHKNLYAPIIDKRLSAAARALGVEPIVKFTD